MWVPLNFYQLIYSFYLVNYDDSRGEDDDPMLLQSIQTMKRQKCTFIDDEAVDSNDSDSGKLILYTKTFI